MSMHLNFEPHTWYMGFAIKRITRTCWNGYIDNGNTYQIDEIRGELSLDRLKQLIREYHLSKHNGYGERIAKRRLEQIRASLIAESASYDEIAELQSLREYIAPGDVQLLEPAGVPEEVAR